MKRDDATRLAAAAKDLESVATTLKVAASRLDALAERLNAAACRCAATGMALDEVRRIAGGLGEDSRGRLRQIDEICRTLEP